MKTFVKIFTEKGYGGEKRLEDRINEVAERGDLEIVTINTCFDSSLTSDRIFVTVVYKRKENEK